VNSSSGRFNLKTLIFFGGNLIPKKSTKQIAIPKSSGRDKKRWLRKVNVYGITTG